MPQETDPGHEGGSRSGLEALSEEECLALLRRATVARLAWCTARGPVVVPVNISVDDRVVLVRTATSSAMAAKVDAERVAVQIDRADRDEQTGWSVLARGVASVTYAPDSDDGPTPWVGGGRSVLVRVAIDELEGRRITASH